MSRIESLFDKIRQFNSQNLVVKILIKDVTFFLFYIIKYVTMYVLDFFVLKRYHFVEYMKYVIKKAPISFSDGYMELNQVVQGRCFNGHVAHVN